MFSVIDFVFIKIASKDDTSSLPAININNYNISFLARIESQMR